MEKILIALDYGPSSQKIAETGYALAKSMNAKVVLLHVVADITYYSAITYPSTMGFEGFNNLDAVHPEIFLELNKAAQQYLTASKEHLGDETIETVIKDGDFGTAILETAAEINADVIVLGTHSRHGLDKILMGSVAEKVLHHSSVPLFIIPVKDPE